MASLILLVAMIGAIVLTMHKGVHVKRQEVFEQNLREFAKTVRKYKIIYIIHNTPYKQRIYVIIDLIVKKSTTTSKNGIYY